MERNYENTAELMTSARKQAGKSKAVYLIIAVVAVAIIAAVVGHFALANKRYNDQVAVAEKYFIEGNYEQAEIEYAAAVAMNPRKTKAREGLAYTKAVNKKYDEAADEYRKLYDDTKDDKYKDAEEDTRNGRVPGNKDLVPAPGVLRWMDPSSVPEADQLKAFLSHYYMFLTDYSAEYDASKAAESGILAALAGDYPVNYEWYPVNQDGVYGTGDSSTTDPRGWAMDWGNGYYMYMQRRVETVNWVAKNIFHATDDDIAAMLERGEANHDFYEQDGYYYFGGARTGVGAFAAEIDSVMTDGNLYYVTYLGGAPDFYAPTVYYKDDAYYTAVDHYWYQEPETYYTVMELVTIDGESYWTMRYHSTTMPEELAKALEAEQARKEAAIHDVSMEEAFGQLDDVSFIFASGAGGWATTMHISPDGTFVGQYHDSDMGDSGDGYPNGTVYICDFHGSFKDVEYVDDYTYRFKIDTLVNEDEEGRVYYEDGVRYIVSRPYGLDDAEVMELYLPGKPAKELTEEFLNWMWGVSGSEEEYKPVMTFYGLYNIGGKQGFAGYKDE
ncbi:MAG: hypothetical protein IJH91_00810 [Mogibacterium sp.]|nr:hypothetical protein [Mogibacterium sp.]